MVGRIAAARVADSQVRQAMAQAESIADNIAFQVNEAYRNAVTAWVSIDDARPAVDQATENYRLVRLRLREGAAIPSEIADAQASLTRAQQNYLNCPVWLLDRDGPPGLCHGGGRDTDAPGPRASLAATKPKHAEQPMSAIQSAQAPPRHARLQAPTATRIDPAGHRRRRFRPGRLLALALLIALIAVGLPLLMSWVEYRRTPLDHRRRLRRGAHRQHRPANGLRPDHPLPGR